MRKISTAVIVFVFLNFCNLTYGQVLTARVIDSTSQQPIPYATVLLANKKGVITNEEGRFSLQVDNTIKETDSLFISCMGYETVAKPLNQFNEQIIILRPKAIELNDVFVSNKNYTAEEIIDKVKENLNKNYDTNLSRKRIFLRQSNFQNFSKKKYSFKKSSIPELNKPLLDSVLNAIPDNFSYYSEILCDYFGNQTKDQQKIKLIKASELYDKKKEIGFESLLNRFNDILKEHVKPDSYLKIKSGWFGTKVDADEILNMDSSAGNENSEKEEEQKSFAEYRKKTIAGLNNKLFFVDGTDLNFISKPRKYNFNIIDYSYIVNNPVYVISFEPKGRADYKGTLFVAIDDFAILRVEYENVKSIRDFNLLGVSYNEYLSKGKMIFSKKQNATKYSLLFLEHTTGGKFGVRRPLKIVEKNKNVRGRRKQNELKLEIDMATNTKIKFEQVVFDNESISSSYFQNLQEKNDQLPTYLPAYDPNFWKGYNIIEPNQAIKEFAAEGYQKPVFKN